jgi:hypothetical protein
MSKDLTNSAVDRQNILNNPYAHAGIEKAAGVRRFPFEGNTGMLKEPVAMFFAVIVQPVATYLEQNTEELSQNGNEFLNCNLLQELKLAI